MALTDITLRAPTGTNIWFSSGLPTSPVYAALAVGDVGYIRATDDGAVAVVEIDNPSPSIGSVGLAVIGIRTRIAP